MKEIEVKAKLSDRKSVIEKLSSLGYIFTEPVKQKDMVFAKEVGTLEKYNSNEVFLRIREINEGKILFTVKKPLTNLLEKYEYEVEVSSKDEMVKAIELIGFKLAVNTDKSRITTRHNGCEICIDEIDGLGSFIEMEKMSENADIKKTQDELFAFLLSIGVKAEDRVHFGYDILTLRKAELGHL